MCAFFRHTIGDFELVAFRTRVVDEERNRSYVWQFVGELVAIKHPTAGWDHGKGFSLRYLSRHRN